MEEGYIDIGSKIITIAIILNGNIIKTNLEPAEENIFDNTRLFKLANSVTEPGVEFTEIQKNDISISRIHVLNIVFQNDLPLSTYMSVCISGAITKSNRYSFFVIAEATISFAVKPLPLTTYKVFPLIKS